MCVIITKTKDQAKPSKEFLEKAWKTNPDGAGIMWNKDNKVYIAKGYMTFEEFWKVAKNLPESSAIVYHFRIATHGTKDARGTHPFPISSRDEVLQQPFVKTSVGVAHNGIIQLCSNYPEEKNKHELSDTQLFIRDYLSILARNENWYRNDKIMSMIDKLIGSKMAILNNNNEIFYVGDFVDVDGYKCSNSYFKPSYRDYGYAYGYGSLYDRHSYGSLYDDYDFPTTYKPPLDVKPLRDEVFVEDLNSNEWFLLENFEKVKICSSDALILDDEYIRTNEGQLIDQYGRKVSYAKAEEMLNKLLYA